MATKLIARCGGRSDRRTEGLSLLEVVFAVVILTILTLSALLIVIPVSKQVRVSREIELANTEAQKILERIQTTPFFEITADYPDGPFGYPGKAGPARLRSAV